MLTNEMRINVLIWREDDAFIVRSVDFGTTTQGRTMREAMSNFKEAFELSMEDEDFRRMVKQRKATQRSVVDVQVILPFDVDRHPLIGDEQASNRFWSGSRESPL